ncbi:hypothetical protein [Nocardia sp. NPDC057668]|uniref:hypothetical protein n=1 Tax=Nocardia sp. NPDC057668 TaxID=3346202 RepID=UPI0036711422
MGRNSAVCFAFATVVLVSGCDSVSGLDTDPKPAESAATASSTSQTTSAPTSSAPAGPVALPDCPEGVVDELDCRARTQDKTGVVFDSRRTPEGTVTIEVIAPDGTVTQTITEQAGDRSANPRAIDTDSDGRDELVIPVEVGPYWYRFVVYHATGDATEYTRAGEFPGTGIDPTPDGLAHTAHKNGYQSVTHTFWTYENDVMVPVVIAESKFTNGTDAPPVCTITSAPGLSKTSFKTVAAARTHFCAQAAES